MAENEPGRFQEIVDGLSSQNKEEKLLSISAMGVLKIPEHADYLADLLSSPDKDIVEKVLIALGKIGNPSSIKYIVEFVLDDFGKLSKVAYEILCNFHSESSVDYLIKFTGSDQPVGIRLKLIKIISRYEDVRIASLMNEIMGQTKDSKLLTEAITYFIRFPSAEQHTVLKMHSTNKVWEVSLSAIIALSRLKDESAFTHIKRLVKSPNSAIRLFLVKALNEYPIIEDRNIYQAFFDDLSPNIREAAIEGLSLFGADERITILKSWIKKEKDGNIRRELYKKAAKEKSPLLFDEFIKLMSENKEMKKLAVDTIAKMGNEVSDRIIIDFEKYPLVVKEQSVLILGKIGSDKAVETIQRCLNGKSRWLKINAIEASVYLGSDELIEELATMVQDEKIDCWVKATIISAFGNLGNQDYVGIIIESLKHDDARVRANAIEALSCLNWENLPQICLEMLKDRNDRVRVNAAIALWKSGSKEIFSELENMTKDKSKWVRSSAVFALGKIQEKEATPLLLSMLKDKEDVVYINAIDALSNSGDIRALMPLMRESVSGRFQEDFYVKYLDRFSKTIRE